MEKTQLLNIIDTPGGNPQTVLEADYVASGTSTVSRPPVLPADPIDPRRPQTLTGSCGYLEREALVRANDAVLARLKKIDEIAAERGLEVGGEGGEKTGLARVDRAVKECKGGNVGSRGGILNLLEGAGLEGHGQRPGGAEERLTGEWT